MGSLSSSTTYLHKINAETDGGAEVSILWVRFKDYRSHAKDNCDTSVT